MEASMSDRLEATLSIIAAFLVLFSALLDPKVSAGLAVAFLVGFGAYKGFLNKKSG
jgi:hypothetical protein